MPDQKHRSVAYRIAGGKRAFSRLPRGERLAILTRAKELHQLGAEVGKAAQVSASRILEGFVYAIVRDDLDGYVKIGSAVDAESRLGDAQTWDPHRRFRVAHAVFVPDRNASERRIHKRLKAYRMDGEWFALSLRQAKDALDAEVAA